MKILVLGGSGLIGNFFIHNSINHEIITTFNKTKINASNAISKKINLPEDWAKLQDLILEEKPDVVLNSMAFSNIDFCEINKEEVYALHVKITEKITALCSKINSKIVFLSTDYVFDGKKGNYTENDETNPINYYGHSKDLAEKILRICNYEPEIIYDKSKPMGQSRRTLKNDKASKILGFKTITPLDEGLKSTINWVKNNIKFE